jgi:hypothetical protein
LIEQRRSSSRSNRSYSVVLKMTPTMGRTKAMTELPSYHIGRTGALLHAGRKFRNENGPTFWTTARRVQENSPVGIDHYR